MGNIAAVCKGLGTTAAQFLFFVCFFVCVHWAEMKNATDRTITERSQQLTDSIRRCCDTPITNTSTAFHKSTSRWRIMSSPVSTVRFSAPGPRPPSAVWARAPAPLPEERHTLTSAHVHPSTGLTHTDYISRLSLAITVTDVVCGLQQTAKWKVIISRMITLEGLHLHASFS